MKRHHSQGFLAAALFGVLSVASSAHAATRADVHVAVYASGFVVDSQRQVTYGDRARRVQIKTKTQGTAQGETPETAIEIDRVDQGLQWRLDPRTKTYSEERLQAASGTEGASATKAPVANPTLKISKIDPTVTGPIGSATINGLPCQSYTIRIVADFTNPQTGKIVATETLLEKLWVTEKAPNIVLFRQNEEQFRDAMSAVYGMEKANFRWLLREFNRMILENNGNPEDFVALQKTYQGARATIKGVTVRQLAGWNWRPKDVDAPGSDAGDMNAWLASIAAGLGAPPDESDKTPLADSAKPKWVQELEKDLGRTGSSAMLLEEILAARSTQVPADYFEIPQTYRKL